MAVDVLSVSDEECMSETLNGVDSMSLESNDSQELPITHKSESQMETAVNHGEQENKTKTPKRRSKGAKPQTPLKKVVVCFDVGSSLNKILYQVEGQDVQYMVMEPEHLALPPESEASLPVDSGMGRPEDNAWIQFKKGEKCHAVGRVADDFKASVNLKTLKWEIATPKILGAIGAIAEREKLGTEFRLDLGVLLPFGEITSTEQLESELKSSLRGFYFRHQRLKVKLERYKCVPEGSGLAMWTGMNNRSAFTRKNVAFLMFGHRNTSSLFFRKGTLCRQLCSTTELGFYDLTDKMGHKVAGLQRNDVLRAIKTQHNGYWKQGSWPKKIASEINWSVITKSTDKERAAIEVEKLSSAYDTSLREYWALVSDWLNSTLRPKTEIDGVFCCGGAAEFLLDLVSEYFEGIEVLMPSACPSELGEALRIDKEIKENNEEFLKLNLINRFTDVWGFFSIFSGYEVEHKEAA